MFLGFTFGLIVWIGLCTFMVPYIVGIDKWDLFRFLAIIVFKCLVLL